MRAGFRNPPGMLPVGVALLSTASVTSGTTCARPADGWSAAYRACSARGGRHSPRCPPLPLCGPPSPLSTAACSFRINRSRCNNEVVADVKWVLWRRTERGNTSRVLGQWACYAKVLHSSLSYSAVISSLPLPSQEGSRANSRVEGIASSSLRPAASETEPCARRSDPSSTDPCPQPEPVVALLCVALLQRGTSLRR